MVSKFTVIPLAIMFLLSMASLTGLGTATSLGNGNINPYQVVDDTGTTQSMTSNTLYYDIFGHPVCYANLTQYGETGQVIQASYAQEWAQWKNGTFNSVYIMCYDTLGAHFIRYSDIAVGGVGLDSLPRNQASIEVNMYSSFGMIGVVIALMALMLLIGIKFFSSGESDISIGFVAKSTGYLSLWAILSVISLSMLGQLPMYTGYILFFALSAMYVIAMIDSIGHPSGE